MSVIEYVCRAALVVVLVLASVGKARALAGFHASLTDLAWLPGAARPVVAVAVPLAEAVAAVLLVVPGTTVAGYVLSAGLLVAFSTVTGWALLSRRRVRCACFGPVNVLGPGELARNLFLLTTAVLGLTTTGSTEPGPAATLVGVAAGALGGYLTTRWSDFSYLVTGR